MAGVKRRMFTDRDINALYKELDEVSCPICMDHPHNAVLLLCSSREKGCRSYICDTSYRHSNCLDRFKKLRDNSRNKSTLLRPVPTNLQSSDIFDVNLASRTALIENGNHNLNETNGSTFVRLQGNIQDPSRHLDSQGEGILEIGDSVSLRERVELEELDSGNSSESKPSLKCPMCRGDVVGWEVVEEARKYLNLKKRSCSGESCSFSGNYQELRRHARKVHPTTRPSDIDPSREQAWRHFENQRDIGDVMSVIHSAIPDGVVVGDYVIENGDRVSAGRVSGPGEVSTPWFTSLFLFEQVFSPIDGIGEPRVRSRAWSRHRRNAGALSERRYLWGENLLGLHDDDDDDDVPIFSDVDEDASPIPRTRRRVMRSRSDEDQS
ncbi:hypothetical protein SLE2022_248150 [Rubroshorea leprosula]